MSSQSCKWCFTIHSTGTGDGDESLLVQQFDLLDSPLWGVYGGAQLERCPETNRLHIQGFVVFSTNKRLPKGSANTGVKAVHPTAHWEVMHGSLESSEAYCSKETSRAPGTFPKVWGVRPVNRQGKRTDLESACAALLAASGDVDDRMRTIAPEHAACVAKYGSGLERLARYTEEPDLVMSEPAWRPWQLDLKQKLSQPADDRSILVYIDPVGGAGKSTVMRYFVTNKDLRACVLSGQIRDMAFAFCQKKYRIVFFDISRTSAEHVVHLLSFAETLKNGVIFSSKYESGMHAFKSPHIVFFSNEDLPTVNGHYGGWTADRPKVTYLSGPSFVSESTALPFDPPPLFAPSASDTLGAGAALRPDPPNPFLGFSMSQMSMFED